jgi:hypothetical protein
MEVLPLRERHWDAAPPRHTQQTDLCASLSVESVDDVVASICLLVADDRFPLFECDLT